MKTRTCLLSSVGAIVLAASSVIAGGVMPATAAPRSPINRYVALGDSYAAGQGAGPYRNSCLQSTNGYPALLGGVKGTNLLRNASCSGATTGDVMTTQLSSLNRGTTLVTLTVGGDDLNVAAIEATCTQVPANPANCVTAIYTAEGQLPGLGAALATTYADIAAAAPNARILVTGYPRLFDTGASDPDHLYSLINGATDALNGTVDEAVTAARGAGANIDYVDVGGLFQNNEMNDNVSWFNITGTDAFHPTAAGYVAYESALQAAL
jgi:lysophospholipase L1-like esterase